MDARGLLGRVRRRAMRLVKGIHELEHHAGIPDPVRKLDLNLGMAVFGWSRGMDFADLPSVTSAAEGDIIRTLRMTIQVLRELRKATKDKALREKLVKAERAINRGAVDAERQLRAGCDEPPDATNQPLTRRDAPASGRL